MFIQTTITFGFCLMACFSWDVQSVECDTFSLQCSDTVGWATGMASSLYKAGCWLVGGDYLTGALHVLLAPVKSRRDILVQAYPGCPGK